MNIYFAVTYNCGAYGNSTYDNANACGGSNGGSSSLLSNTGFDIAVIATVACVIILTAMAIRIWKRPKKPIRQA